MIRSRWMVLLTESFVPFFVLIISLVVALLIIDRRIENRDEILVINLNREDTAMDEQITVSQKILIQTESATILEWANEVNSLIENRSWDSAIWKILSNKNRPDIFNDDTRLTLGYLYYKKGSIREGLNILATVVPEKNPRYYYNMGLLQSEESRSYHDAINSFTKFMEYKEHSYEAAMNIGHLYYKLGDFGKSMEYYIKSANLSSLSRKARAFYRAALCEEKLQNEKETLNYLNMAIRLDPELVPARVHRAKINLLRDTKNALSDLVRTSKAYPEYIETYQVLSGYFLDIQENEKALTWTKEGLKQAPNSIRFKSGVGVIYLRLKEYQKALEVFQSLSEQFPRVESYYFYMGRAYFGLENLNMAAQMYLEALKFKPVYYEAFVNLGIVYSRLNLTDRAIEYYQKAISIAATDPKIYFNLGILHSKSGKFSEAIRYYQKAISFKQDYPEAYYNMGVAYSRANDLKNAEKAYQKAISLKIDYTSAYYNLALHYEDNKNLKKAMSTLQAGIDSTKNTKLMIRLGQEYLKDNNHKKAREIFQDIIRLDPENDRALMELAEIGAEMKNFPESKKFIEQYLIFKPKDPEGRYIYMVDLYNTGAFKEAWKQYEILSRIAPAFRNTQQYRILIQSKMI